MIGAWCFADHFGPVQLNGQRGMEVGPHPHMGLQTVTWLLEGEVLHKDSLGFEQLIKPGQLNLMTSGHGMAHSEEPGENYIEYLHGIQLWVAQPESTRNGEPAFEHHAALPQTNFDNATATVLLGTLGTASSPARTDSEIVGAEITLGIGESTLQLREAFEYGIIVLRGRIQVESKILEPGNLGYVGSQRDQLPIYATEPTTIMLIGGEPFGEAILMWWNFIGRDQDEMTKAYKDWQSESRFGTVKSQLAKIDAPKPYWL